MLKSGLVWLRAGIAVAALGLVAVAGVRFSLRPTVSDWRPIYRGVDYYAAEMPAPSSGRVMAIRLHLDEPTLQLMMRPLDPELLAQGRQYRLSMADYERSRWGLAVFMNSALYHPGARWRSFPGMPVSALESVLADGRLSHVDPHSYMLWLDRARQPHLETEKPPRPELWKDAWWGVGLQAVQVAAGQVRPQTMAPHHKDRWIPRSFLGFDAEKRVLYLIAFERTNAMMMAAAAATLGVKFGGMMDSGSSTSLLLGPEAADLPRFTGIRGARPLGPYLGVWAETLN
ncbi:MAG: phosphodiester glycosidase family protein [Acidobacteria bacterium]|nr:phosphodiester glycosidase family protein [Acidobacteriota bacterium]